MQNSTLLSAVTKIIQIIHVNRLLQLVSMANKSQKSFSNTYHGMANIFNFQGPNCFLLENKKLSFILFNSSIRRTKVA